jgi:hypothetical protein
VLPGVEPLGKKAYSRSTSDATRSREIKRATASLDRRVGL